MNDVIPAVGRGNVFGIVQVGIRNRYSNNLVSAPAGDDPVCGNSVDLVGRPDAFETHDRFQLGALAVVTNGHLVVGTSGPDRGGRRFEPNLVRAGIDERFVAPVRAGVGIQQTVIVALEL